MNDVTHHSVYKGCDPDV